MVQNHDESLGYFSYVWLMEVRSSLRGDRRERRWWFRMENQGGSNHRKLERSLAGPKGPTEVKDKTKPLNQNKIVYRGKK